ncbi:MAG: molybdopterin molybdotransferase MoeA [Luteolibacter sp.]
MLSFRDALARLLAVVPVAREEVCRIEGAAGRVLRREVKANRDFPAFDRVMMDGFALRAGDWEKGIREFQVAGSAPAGAPRMSFDDVAAGRHNPLCVEVMTGAPCPSGADAIVPVEEVLRRGDGRVIFREAKVVAGEFIHRAGSDARKGSVLLEEGGVLGGRELGVAASCGAAELWVSALPKIAVLATGDELVAVDETPLPHQIRQSNAHAIGASLQRTGYPVRTSGVLGDEVDASRDILTKILEEHDWVILTGAVSMGARDFVPALLDELGCKKLFHGVAQRPGKPAGCWIGPAGQIVMTLPGNPVSALTGLHVFVLPALAKSAELKESPRRLVVMEDRQVRLPGMTRHLPVRLRADGRAEPAPPGNSGDFIGLLSSDGCVTLPPRGEDSGFISAFHFTPWL